MYSSSAPPKVVVISGITVQLAEHLKNALHVMLSIDGADSHSVSLKRDGKLMDVHLFPSALNLGDGSTLFVQVQEVRRFRSDKTLLQLNLSHKDIWLAQDPSPPNAYVKKYQLHLPDPNQQIWLNVFMVRPYDVDNPTFKKVPDNYWVDNALKEATHSLQKFKTTFEQQDESNRKKGLNIRKLSGELQSTTKIVVRFVRIVHKDDQYHKAILEDLAKSIEGTLRCITAAGKVAYASKDTIPTFYEMMKKTVDFIKKWLSDAGIPKNVNILTEVESLKKECNALGRELDLIVVVDSVDYVAKSQELFQELEVALGGIKEVSSRVVPCMEGTRINILYDAERMIDDLEGKNIVWIRGAPGSGKSAVSLTIKSRLHEQARLVTYFRFDRNDGAVTTSRTLWCHVAYGLAKLYPSVLQHNLSLLRKDRVDLTSTADLFKSLVEEPLSKLGSAQSGQPFIIVIDALDECGGFEGRSSPDRKDLLQILCRWHKLPIHLKLLVTSRDEFDIAQALYDISAPVDIQSGRFLIKHPNDSASINALHDIRYFFDVRFQDIRLQFPSLLTDSIDWPGADIIDDMVQCADGNFVLATAATKFIGTGYPKTRLDNIMGDAPRSLSMKPLYSLYSVILDISFGAFSRDSSKIKVLRAVLGVTILAQRPLCDVEYTKLPTSEPVDMAMVELIKRELRPVIDRGPTLQFAHQSFDDFLLSEECSSQYRIRTDETQHLLTKLCLKTMMAELCFNVCGLETSYLKNTDVPDIETKVRDGITPLLSYSCCFWTDHLVRTPFDEQLKAQVKEMISDKLLYWFEAMSLLKEINRVSHSLLSVLNWLEPTQDGEFKDFVRDAHRFIGAFIHPIAQCAPHIYISALPFAPKHSSVARHFLPRFPQTLTLSMGKPTDWSPCVFVSEHHEGSINTVTFSPDEKYFISGSDDKTISICDSETGNLISEPFTAIEEVRSSFFDPHGRRVWARCIDGQVTSWDIETGDKHLVLGAARGLGDVIDCCCTNGGRNIICATKEESVTLWNAETGEELRNVLKLPSNDRNGRVAFSPDGNYIAWAGELAETIRIWNLADGTEIHGSSHPQPHFRHMNPISALSFSVGGHFVVTGSTDGTIMLWNAKTGDITGRPLATNESWVSAVAYSHVNKIIVSASSDPCMMTVWDALTYEAILGPLEGHTSIITDIALTHDGRKALSASRDGTVRMWDLGRRGNVPGTHATEGHTNRVYCFVFSPHQTKLASLGDDETIRVWDARTGELLLNPISHLLFYRKHIFSPDGSKIIAFNSIDGTLRAWNASSGEHSFDHDLSDKNHAFTHIQHAAFRSTDQRLVTCFSKGLVRIWNLEEGSLSEELSVLIQRPHLNIIALSPDGSIVIVCDEKRDPSHYLWSTTLCQPLPVTFNDDIHISGDEVAYSPSGRFFASVSLEGILRVWNTQTGELAAGPSKLAGRLMCLAFSPDDSHIAFSYYSNDTDMTAIWIWNAHTDCLASGPWRGHTNRITALSFSPDGEKLVSGSVGGQIRIWDTADLLGHPQPLVSTCHNGTRMKGGWAMGENEEPLFWVPKDHRERLSSARNVAVIGGSGMPTELDLRQFRHGESWTECFGGEK